MPADLAPGRQRPEDLCEVKPVLHIKFQASELHSETLSENQTKPNKITSYQTARGGLSHPGLLSQRLDFRQDSPLLPSLFALPFSFFLLPSLPLQYLNNLFMMCAVTSAYTKRPIGIWNFVTLSLSSTFYRASSEEFSRSPKSQIYFREVLICF